MIVQHPAEVLLTPTFQVQDFTRLDSLVCSMLKAMREFKGIGLAANQIGASERVAVMHVPGWPEMVIVNPKILRSKGESTLSEGCLSVKSGNLRLPVKRAKIVWVEYRDQKGAIEILKATGLLARCIQHELDHLDGLTCLERAQETAGVR
jgi:peptide deformylase